MTISIWRYSHLALAVSSFLFIALASITGIILSIEPVAQKIRPYKVRDFNKITLAETIPAIKKVYPEITELTVDHNQFTILSGTSQNGESIMAYIDPRTGKALGVPNTQGVFFQWVTALHRSLFLKEPGRFFIGLTAFLLLLIAVSGTVLIIQRQRGLKRFFTKIVKENFAQYYHVVLGRLSLVPIIIIALSGTYLSLARFDLIKDQKISHEVEVEKIRSGDKTGPSQFQVFKNIHLADVQSIEFPFSEELEDYYTIKLNDREVIVNQINGDILSNLPYPATALLTNLSLDLHTGRTSGIWAVVLGIATVNILFFIYSGFAITLKRRANRIKNKFSADESRFIILVGSENGNTFRFAKAIYQQLVENGEKPFITELNNYKAYPKAEHIVIFTATYGLGDPPTNATKTLSLIEKIQQQQPIKFSVVGFGSHAYPDFCKFAFEVNNQLSLQNWASALLEIQTVNDKSPDTFMQWASLWFQKVDLQLKISVDTFNTKHTGVREFLVTGKSELSDAEGAFLIRLSPKRRGSFTSGDILAIYPRNDHAERLYSIGRIGNSLLLSVKLHPNGLGSNYLYNRTVGDAIKARIDTNSHFHFPEKASTVIMVSNGTGIAPFLGMLDENSKKIPCYLYCGFRGQASFEVYREIIDSSLQSQKLSKLCVAYSREGEKQYVKDLLMLDEVFIANTLKSKGVIMICGSLAMQQNVVELLEIICVKYNGKSVSYYQSHSQILMDCY